MKIHITMKPLILSALALLISSTFTLAQTPRWPLDREDPEAQWFYTTFAAFSGRNHDGYNIGSEELDALLKDEAIAKRLTQLARRVAEFQFSERALSHELGGMLGAPSGSVIRMLGRTGTDEAVEIIAPLLKHPHSHNRIDACLMLGETQNPKAVPYLIDVMYSFKPQPTDVSGLFFNAFAALSNIRTKESLAALDAALRWYENEYVKKGIGKERFEYMKIQRDVGATAYHKHQEEQSEKVFRESLSSAVRESRETGVSFHKIIAKHEKAARERVAAGSTFKLSKTSSATTTTATPETEPAESSSPVWLITLAVAFLAGLGYVFYRRK